MTESEIILISRYSAAELAGSILLGKYARSTKKNYLRSQLTWQCYEEAEHAWKWAKILHDQSLPLLEIHDKNEYFSYASELKNEIEFLVFAHIYELRADFHLKTHITLPSLDPSFKKTMQRIIEDEDQHLDWIAIYLKKIQKEGNKEVVAYIKKWGKFENKTYIDYISQLASSDDKYFRQLGELIEKNLSNYEFSWKKFLQD